MLPWTPVPEIFMIPLQSPSVRRNFLYLYLLAIIFRSQPSTVALFLFDLECFPCWLERKKAVATVKRLEWKGNRVETSFQPVLRTKKSWYVASADKRNILIILATQTDAEKFFVVSNTFSISAAHPKMDRREAYGWCSFLLGWIIRDPLPLPAHTHCAL